MNTGGVDSTIKLFRSLSVEQVHLLQCVMDTDQRGLPAIGEDNRVINALLRKNLVEGKPGFRLVATPLGQRICNSVGAI